MTGLHLKKTCTYIYELPYSERKELCNIIDINGKWEELGKYIHVAPWNWICDNFLKYSIKCFKKIKENSIETMKFSRRSVFYKN